MSFMTPGRREKIPKGSESVYSDAEIALSGFVFLLFLVTLAIALMAELVG